MTLTDSVNELRTALAGGFNSYLENHLSDKGDYLPLTYTEFVPDPEASVCEMGIYTASGSGSSFKKDGSDYTTYAVIDCIIDRKHEHSSLPEKYLSILIEYLNELTFGVMSHTEEGDLVRVDLGAQVNAFSLAVRITFRVDRDADYENLMAADPFAALRR